MDFSAFDAKKLDEYIAQAKATWGKTDAYREYEEKTKNTSKEKQWQTGEELMAIIAEFGPMLQMQPDSLEVQAQVKKIQDFITENFYTCTNEIFAGLGKMYNGGGSMTENIDKFGGEGTADFAAAFLFFFKLFIGLCLTPGCFCLSRIFIQFLCVKC